MDSGYFLGGCTTKERHACNWLMRGANFKREYKEQTSSQRGGHSPDPSSRSTLGVHFSAQK